MNDSVLTVFTVHEGIAVPLDRANVDTDQIIPKQFLKSIQRTGFGDNLFDAWRFHDEGEIGIRLEDRQVNKSFVFNDHRYADASILLARRNFGCGSSREHAVWALQQYGFKCVIAPSFADIFFNNCFKNGLLPVVLNESAIDQLFESATGPRAILVLVDLNEQFVRVGSDFKVHFDIDEIRKIHMINGLDEIGLTLKHKQLIREFEQRHRQRMPWLFENNHG